MSRVTPRQERILGPLCSGLRSGLARDVLTWRAGTVAGETKITRISGIPDDIWQAWQREAITLADIEDFVDLGLMRKGQQDGILLLNAEKIIDFADNFYEFDTPALQPVIINLGGNTMEDCHLTEAQKNMLVLIADGLEKGRIKTDWQVVYADGGIFDIVGLDDYEPGSVADDDINAYIECGLMTEPFKTLGKSSRNIRLHKGCIINFVNSNFSPHTPQPQHTIGTINITGSQNVNVANINSMIRQTLQNTTAADSDERTQLIALIQNLEAVLKMLPAEHSEAKEEIQTETKALVDAVDNKRSREVIERKANTLVKAAEVVRKVSNEIILTATAISTFVLKLKYLSEQ